MNDFQVNNEQCIYATELYVKMGIIVILNPLLNFAPKKLSNTIKESSIYLIAE